MKNLLVANYRPHGRTTEKELRALVEAQIENSLAVGWSARDIVIVSNLDFDYPITLVRTPLNEECLTGSKMFALEHLFQLGLIKNDEMWWAHDLDAWQNHWFEEPALADIGLTEYSKPSFNGGSVFLRAAARDLVLAITDHIRRHRIPREEPAIDQILRLPAHTARVTVLNSTYNVGCSAYAVRYQRSTHPILVSHFHPSGISWRTHVWGWNKINTPSVSSRLVALLVRRFHHGMAPIPSAEDLRRPSSPRHYRLRESFSLGDSWARLNYAFRLLENGDDFPIYLPNRLTQEIFELLDLGALPPRLLRHRRNPDESSKKLFHQIENGLAAYRCTYFPTKTRHRPKGNRIGYALDLPPGASNKNAEAISHMLSCLRAALSAYAFEAVGEMYQGSLTEIVSILSRVELFITLDNGVAQIARSVGVPLFLLEGLHPDSHTYSAEGCQYIKDSVEDVVARVIAHLKSLAR